MLLQWLNIVDNFIEHDSFTSDLMTNNQVSNHLIATEITDGFQHHIYLIAPWNKFLQQSHSFTDFFPSNLQGHHTYIQKSDTTHDITAFSFIEKRANTLSARLWLLVAWPLLALTWIYSLGASPLWELSFACLPVCLPRIFVGVFCSDFGFFSLELSPEGSFRSSSWAFYNIQTTNHKPLWSFQIQFLQWASDLCYLVRIKRRIWLISLFSSLPVGWGSSISLFWH